MIGVNVGSGQRKFRSTPEIQWINVDSVSRPGCEPDLVCDGAHLPHESGSVDYVVLHHVLEHFGCGEGAGLIAEAHRILKPTGSLLVFVPNLRPLAERWLQGQIDTQLFVTNLYGAYMGDEADRHKWGFDNVSLYDFLHRFAWERISTFSGRPIPGADIAQDWWIIGAECVRGQDEHVLILTRNNLELTKRTVESVRSQDKPTSVHIVDNGSTDGTLEWAEANSILLDASDHNAGVSHGWNRGLSTLFENRNCHQVLVLNNDTVIPPWFVRELSSYNVPFVTGVAVDQMDMIRERPARMQLQNNPDFSAFMIRRDCWEKVGPFDERMKLYASDCDFHVRAHKLGMPLFKACLPYYHERSSTLNCATPEDRQRIETQANEDRAVFLYLHSCLPGQPEYSALFARSHSSD